MRLSLERGLEKFHHRTKDRECNTILLEELKVTLGKIRCDLLDLRQSGLVHKADADAKKSEP